MALKPRYVRTLLRDASEIVSTESPLQVGRVRGFPIEWERKEKEREKQNFYVESRRLFSASDHANW